MKRHADGSLLLRPERERLSEVLRETESAVFRDHEFAEHLARVAAAETISPRTAACRGCLPSERSARFDASSVVCRAGWQAAFLAMLPPVRRGPERDSTDVPTKLRVKRVQGADCVWEITFAPDGRATFFFGDEVVSGEAHVIWRRVSTYEC